MSDFEEAETALEHYAESAQHNGRLREALALLREASEAMTSDEYI